MNEQNIVQKIWLGYAEKVLFKPKTFWDIHSANEWVKNAPVNYGKCFIKQYNIAKPCVTMTESKLVDLELIHKIGVLIAADKFEHATRDPIFLVQQKIRDYGYSEDYTSDFEWFDDDGQEIVEERIAKRLSALDSNYREIPKKYTKVCYKERWEFVTCCFTRESAEAFIKRQAHNLKETRIWVDSLFRNAEMIAVREYLKSNEVESLRERVKELEKKNRDALDDDIPGCND